MDGSYDEPLFPLDLPPSDGSDGMLDAEGSAGLLGAVLGDDDQDETVGETSLGSISMPATATTYHMQRTSMIVCISDDLICFSRGVELQVHSVSSKQTLVLADLTRFGPPLHLVYRNNWLLAASNPPVAMYVPSIVSSPSEGGSSTEAAQNALFLRTADGFLLLSRRVEVQTLIWGEHLAMITAVDVVSRAAVLGGRQVPSDCAPPQTSGNRNNTNRKSRNGNGSNLLAAVCAPHGRILFYPLDSGDRQIAPICVLHLTPSRTDYFLASSGPDGALNRDVNFLSVSRCGSWLAVATDHPAITVIGLPLFSAQPSHPFAIPIPNTEALVAEGELDPIFPSQAFPLFSSLRDSGALQALRVTSPSLKRLGKLHYYTTAVERPARASVMPELMHVDAAFPYLSWCAAGLYLAASSDYLMSICVFAVQPRLRCKCTGECNPPSNVSSGLCYCAFDCTAVQLLFTVGLNEVPYYIAPLAPQYDVLVTTYNGPAGCFAVTLGAKVLIFDAVSLARTQLCPSASLLSTEDVGRCGGRYVCRGPRAVGLACSPSGKYLFTAYGCCPGGAVKGMVRWALCDSFGKPVRLLRTVLELSTHRQSIPLFLDEDCYPGLRELEQAYEWAEALHRCPCLPELVSFFETPRETCEAGSVPDLLSEWKDLDDQSLSRGVMTRKEPTPMSGIHLRGLCKMSGCNCCLFPSHMT